MKKCPGCGSFSADEEASCGVCGTSISNTAPITDSMEEIDVKDQAIRKSQDRKEAIAQLHRIAVRATAGLAVGLGILAFAGIAITQNGFGTPTLVYGSFLLIPLGLSIIASVLLGGFGFNSFREYLHFRARWPLLLVQQAPPDDNEKTEQEREAEQVERETS